MSDLTLLPSNAVEVAGERTFTTSLMVAQVFEKRHDHVLRDIEGLDCSPEFRAPNFGETFREVPGPNNAIRQERYFELTKDGFTFLVMGYTGAKAAQFKEAYIKRFNELEAQSRGENPAIRDGARFLAVVRDGRFLLEEISGDSFVLPASGWPRVVQTSNFPEDLLPELLEAIGARMKRLPGQAISPRPHTASNHDAREQALQKITEAKSKGISRRDLHMQCHAYRKLGRAKRLNLIKQMIENKDIFEMDVLNPKTKRKNRVLVAAAFVKTEQGGQA